MNIAHDKTDTIQLKLFYIFVNVHYIKIYDEICKSHIYPYITLITYLNKDITQNFSIKI